jgi:hypothetical protein
MKRFATALIITLLLTPVAQAQEQGVESLEQQQSIETPLNTQTSSLQNPRQIVPGSKLYIEPGDFRQIMSAAILKKKVPVTLVVFRDKADFVLTTATEAKKEGTGERITKILVFGWWAGSGRSFDATVNITNVDGEVVFASSVERGKARKAAQKIAAKIKSQIEKNIAAKARSGN